MEGGLGPFNEVQGVGSLDPSDQDALRTFCDQPGKPTRAQFVADVRRAKRVRFGGEFGQASSAEGARGSAGGAQVHQPGQAQAQGVPQPSPFADSEEVPDLPEDAADNSGGEPRNLAWWDHVSYSSLQEWVPTLGRVPRDTLHELALLRGACCRAVVAAQAAGDLVSKPGLESF